MHAVMLRLRYVAGVSPAKWLRAWNERRPDLPLEAVRVEQRDQLTELRSGDADVAFVRLPVDDEGLHTIEFWDERAVAVLPKGHPLAEAESLILADLENDPLAPVQPEAAMTVELVAAGSGHAILPHGVARLHHRRDVVAIPVTDAPTTRIALVWRVERDDADVQDFVAVVRGRTARSSRRAESEADAADATADGTGKAAGKGNAKAGSGKGSAKAGTGKGGSDGAKPRTGGKAANRGGRGAGGGTKSGRPGKGSKGGAHGGGKGGRGRGGRGGRGR